VAANPAVRPAIRRTAPLTGPSPNRRRVGTESASTLGEIAGAGPMALKVMAISN